MTNMGENAWMCEKCREIFSNSVKRPEDSICFDCKDSPDFITKFESLRRAYRDGLINRSEYFIQIINLCTSELYTETQNLYDSKWKLEKIIREVNK